MNKILLIIRREYLTRVKKRSFIVMTLLTPVFIAAMFVIPVWLMTREDSTLKKIAVIEEGTAVFHKVIPDTKFLTFEYLEDQDIEPLKQNFMEMGYYGILYISPKVSYVPSAIQLISEKQPPLDIIMHIENALENEIERYKLENFNIQNLDEILKSVETNIKIQTIKISDTGEEKRSFTGITMGIAYVAGFLIYIFTFMFGAQVMRGVIEEKVSRVVEVIISSVKPFQLMMGKIVGIALVGLTQFLIWVILTGAIVGTTRSVIMPDAIGQQLPAQSVMSTNPMQQSMTQPMAEMNEAEQFFEAIYSVPWGYIIALFIFFFLGGYLLYASLFAAVGSAVDNETDTQQFMLPITIPLILALFVMMSAFQNPDSSIAFWFSIIPFTSPIVMMARIPFGVPPLEVALSMGLLVATFIFTTWVAGKIYRTGILMYGKKSSYREIWKWLRYKN